MTEPSTLDDIITRGTTRVLISLPTPLVIRNILASGLSAELRERFGIMTHAISPYPQPSFAEADGEACPNIAVPASKATYGLPQVEGATGIDRLFKGVHLAGFAIEYPDGSLQNMELSQKRTLHWWLARGLVSATSRTGGARRLLRRLYGRYRPHRPNIAAAFDRVRPALVVTASPGHNWLDLFVIDEARRRGIPVVCLLLSWDNLYSRGPLDRRPDLLLVWSEEMLRQAMDVHQLPRSSVEVTGALQFRHYQTMPTAEESQAMRRRVGLGEDEAYLAYVCGVRTSEYDVEDIEALTAVLEDSRFANHRLVVRPHPQGNKQAYQALESRGVILDRSLDLTGSSAAPQDFEVSAMRHMAALLGGADVVLSSWGTTALLEACIFDRPSIQLRWMDSVPHSLPTQVQMVRDFVRYLHLRPFDAIAAREYCDRPSELLPLMERMLAHEVEYRNRRQRCVEAFAKQPLGEVTQRVADVLERRFPSVLARMNTTR